MDSYNEHDDQRELAIIIHEKENQHDGLVVRGSRQETLDPGFVLLGTRQQSVPAILRELVLPGGWSRAFDLH
ncbi:unnamed protein product [Schistosoma margrebowiei]|uniref:Uncharacterized protein n=1 Tax=Schistosoma margrebowiei TaxID=48269 RepID=A0A183LRG4_9TREM|nr:unnamed protein product [Schistosoma margrebowiei]